MRVGRRRAGARVLAPRHQPLQGPAAPRHEDAVVRVFTAQIQEVPGLAEAVGRVRGVHSVLLQELAG